MMYVWTTDHREGRTSVSMGSREDYRKNLGCVVAHFPVSVNPTLYQSPELAKKRAEALAELLRRDENA